MVKTKINELINNWTRIKNHCRTTVNKEFTENEPKENFKKKLLISEHSPIRLLEVDWSWRNIPYWVSTELSRHKNEKFISTQRTDRTGVNRSELPQGSLVNFDGYANAQNLIDIARKRLCYQATNEARELVESLKIELQNDEKELSGVLVPNCIYRGGCPEFTPCGYYGKFLKYCNDNNLQINTIQQRYDAYNKFFYEQNKNI